MSAQYQVGQGQVELAALTYTPAIAVLPGQLTLLPP